MFLYFFLECLFNVTLVNENGNNLTLSDLLSSVWPQNRSNWLQNSSKSVKKFQNCSFFFHHRISISQTKRREVKKHLSCEFEFQFFSFDVRTSASDKRGNNEFSCINGDPSHFVITVSANVPPWQRNVIHVRRKNVVENNSEIVNQKKLRRHVVMKRPLSEKICSDEMLPKFSLKDGIDNSVDFERRFEILNGIDVCSVMIEMPFGFNAMISVTLEKTGKKMEENFRSKQVTDRLSKNMIMPFSKIGKSKGAFKAFTCCSTGFGSGIFISILS